MPSSFGWIDFADQDRQQMSDLIRLFKERDTRDELGLGSVRDAFANLLFPGTSTIQTRAKYMLFVPWIYLKHEKRQTRAVDIARRARNDETKLIEVLLKSNDTEGVIGKDARAQLQRLPSSIYWSGLGTWGIRLLNGSQAHYHRSLDVFYRRRDEQLRQLKLNGESVAVRVEQNWHPGIPEAPDEFPDQASLTLSRLQAEYLHDRIMTNCGASLLAFLVNDTGPTDTVDFIWMHPDYAKFPSLLKCQVDNARNFSEVMHGAALLYNLMLGEKSGRENDVAKYEGRLTRWSQAVQSRRSDLVSWNLRDFWTVARSEDARMPFPTQSFVESWVGVVLGHSDAVQVTEDERARGLIAQRELTLKGARARLHNQRALELWSGAAGAEPFDYRWSVVKDIVGDILRGLNRNA